MNIAAEELGRDILGMPVNPQNLVHRFGAPYCCTTMSERRKENFHDFFLEALQCPQFFGGENMQLVQPDLFSFAVDFSFFCLLNLVFGSGVTLQTSI